MYLLKTHKKFIFIILQTKVFNVKTYQICFIVKLNGNVCKFVILNNHYKQLLVTFST